MTASYMGMVVWECARPIQLGDKRTPLREPEFADFENMYVLGVFGIPLSPTKQQAGGSPPAITRPATDTTMRAGLRSIEIGWSGPGSLICFSFTFRLLLETSDC